MKLSDVALNLSVIDEGAWVSEIPDLEDVQLKVRGSEYPPYQAALRKVTREMTEKNLGASRKARIRAQEGAFAIDPEAFAARMAEAIAEHLFLDWSGVLADDGTPIPLTKALAREIMTDRRYKPLRDGVQHAIERVDTNTRVVREEALGNSPSTSDGSDPQGVNASIVM